MLFIHPMWDNESQRIGKRKCTPFGYAIHLIAEMIGFVGLLVLIGTSVYLAYRGIAGTFDASLFWLLAVPFGLGIISEVLYQCSWVLALMKGFQYDFERREASWMEKGQRRSYKYQA
jgi:hypothetical protein